MEDITEKGTRMGRDACRKALTGNSTGKCIARKNYAEAMAENIRGKDGHVEKFKAGVMSWKKTGRTGAGHVGVLTALNHEQQ